jgi:hypothetical protein
MIDADGQCSFDIGTEGGATNYKIECHSILKNGRTLMAKFTSVNSWEATFGELRVPGLKAASELAQCERTLQTHGFLSRAQFQCHYRFYDSSMLQEAKACSAKLSEEKAKEIVMAGMRVFDRSALRHGYATESTVST